MQTAKLYKEKFAQSISKRSITFPIMQIISKNFKIEIQMKNGELVKSKYERKFACLNFHLVLFEVFLYEQMLPRWPLAT